MNRTHRIALFAGVLSLAACGQEQPSKNAGGASDIESGPKISSTLTSEAASPPSPRPSLSSPVDLGANPTKADPYAGENDGYPHLSPSVGPGDKGEKGARAVLLTWARGIELREFDQSWQMMGETAKEQLTKPRFNAMFHDLHDLLVAVPSGSSEGAAGSIYYTAPATVTGIARDGSKKRYTGEVVLRRVNDVPGASPAQLTWHIEQVSLKPA